MRKSYNQKFVMNLYSYSFNRCFTKDATGKDLTNVMNELLKDYDKTVRPNYGGKSKIYASSVFLISRSFGCISKIIIS